MYVPADDQKHDIFNILAAVYSVEETRARTLAWLVIEGVRYRALLPNKSHQVKYGVFFKHREQ